MGAGGGVHHRAGDGRGARGTEEGDHVGDFLGRGDAPGGGGSLEPLARLGAALDAGAESFGIGEGDGHHIGGDAAARIVEGDPAEQPLERPGVGDAARSMRRGCARPEPFPFPGSDSG